jgi:hypothetical protein
MVCVSTYVALAEFVAEISTRTYAVATIGTTISGRAAFLIDDLIQDEQEAGDLGQQFPSMIPALTNINLTTATNL